MPVSLKLVFFFGGERAGRGHLKFLATIAKACNFQKRPLAKAEFFGALDQETRSEVVGQVHRVVMNNVLGDGGADLMQDLLEVIRRIGRTELRL